MDCRTFGKTGLSVSLLGFGAMRLPPPDAWDRVDMELAVPLLVEAIQAGVNYIDTAWVYCDGQSELAIAEALKQTRPAKPVAVSTKIIVRENKPVEWRKALDESVARLGRGPDVLHLHDIRWEQMRDVFLAGGLLKEVRRAQSEGLFRFLAFSSHDTPENIIRIIDTDEFDAITTQYNFLYTRNERVIDHAGHKNLGVAIMGPLGGGRFVNLPAPKGAKANLAPSTLAGLALRFAMGHPNVGTVLSGMSTPEQLRENIATASGLQPLSTNERALLHTLAEERQAFQDLYCTGCSYCMPCPQGVNIPRVFTLANLLRVSMHDPARLEYNHMTGSATGADRCAECGLCASKCPQRIEIPQQLKKAHKDLTTW